MSIVQKKLKFESFREGESTDYKLTLFSFTQKTVIPYAHQLSGF